MADFCPHYAAREKKMNTFGPYKYNLRKDPYKAHIHAVLFKELLSSCLAGACFPQGEALNNIWNPVDLPRNTTICQKRLSSSLRELIQQLDIWGHYPLDLSSK